MRSSFVSQVLLVALALLSGCSQQVEPQAEAPSGPSEVRAAEAALFTIDATVPVYRDTYVNEAPLSNVRNFGSESSLKLQGIPALRQRNIVQVSQSALAAAVGTNKVTEAYLELTVQAVSLGGVQVSAHRMKAASTENRATWLCSNDTNTGNYLPDCASGNLWPIGSVLGNSAFEISATDTKTMSSGNTNGSVKVRFNVTTDVKAFLAVPATANNGWLLKITNEIFGSARFGSRESAQAPRLLLDLESSCVATAPADTTCDNADDDCDGTSDEDFVAAATSCGVGACAANGATSCTNGAVADSCMAGLPAASDATCDNTDEDCDGTSDEDFVTAATSCGSGLCVATGALACVGGAVIDTCTPVTSVECDCGNTADDDNDNTVDCRDSDCEGAPECPGGPSEPCNTDAECLGFANPLCATEETSGVPGGLCTGDCEVDTECAAGTQCITGVCLPACDQGTCPVGERCFTVNETLGACIPACTTDADCSGGRVCELEYNRCLAPVCNPTGLADDNCDGIDDDCNGSVDDGFVSTPTTCGVNECTATGATACVNGAIEDSCQAPSECVPATSFSISTSSSWNGSYVWSQLCGEGGVAQTITLEHDSNLDVLSIYARTTTGSAPLSFRVQLLAWDSFANAPTGPVLYSAPDVVTTDDFLHSFSYGFGGLAVPAGTYVIVVNAAGLGNAPNAAASFGTPAFGTDWYTGGTMLFTDCSGRTNPVEYPWYEIPGDLAFDLTASTVLPPAAALVGQRCSTNLDCGSGGTCQTAVPGGYCFMPCDTSQPAGQQCAPGLVCVYGASCVVPCNASNACDDPRFICGDYSAAGLDPDQFCTPDCTESCVNGGTCDPVTRFCQ